MSGIYWLASYPKSGNTWFRVFLSNLGRNTPTPIAINRIDAKFNASNRQLFDDITGITAADLSYEEVERLRPRVYEHIAQEAKEPIFMKIHDAYTYTTDGDPLISHNATLGTIYFIRNPLDVAVSFAYHSACDINIIIDLMADDSHAFCAKPSRLHNQLRQKLLSWRKHVLSWVDTSGLRIHVMRYEDMKLQPFQTFMDAVRFVGLQNTSEQIRKALIFSSFEELQRQEQLWGFREKHPKASSFFNQGKIGSWRENLTLQQINRLTRDHADVMLRFGYLTEDKELVF